MQFVLSWLADYVALGHGLPCAADAAGRHRLAAAGEDALRGAAEIGRRLTSVGLAVEGYPVATSGADREICLDIDITSNRPDCMNHLGVARELAVALGQPLRRPEVPPFASVTTDGRTGSVVLEDAEGCPRFVARVIRGVRLGPSPEWLRRRLEAIGLRSINNVVDVTNFVLWELGQPLHAYDLATVPGGELRVRRARAGEKLVTLDGKERALDPEVLVIADRERPVGLAGIMGGLATEVTERTVDVLLESAHFDRRRVRIGAKRLTLHTDASHRFERGADPEACDFASRRAAALLVEVAGGRVEEPAVDAMAGSLQPVTWRLDPEALARFAGSTIPGDEIERILAGLEFAPQRVGDGCWSGSVPSFRGVDFEPRPSDRVVYAQDVYEEVLRHWGYDRMPPTLPRLSGVDAGASSSWERRRILQDLLAGLGFAEGIHYAFHDRAADERYPALVSGPPIELANPLSDRYAVMRRSLVPNLVTAAEFNLDREASAVQLFEVGHLFPAEGEEVEAVAAVLAGARGTAWDRQPPADLATLAGIFEELFTLLDATPTVEPADLRGVTPGTGAEWKLDGMVVGWMGRLEATEARMPLFAAELLIDRLPEAATRRRVTPPSRVPGIAADLTLTHSRDVSWMSIVAAIAELDEPLRAGFRLKDRYEGAGVPAGAVATTITFDYHAGERTLTQEEVNDRHRVLAEALERRFGVARKEPT